MSDQEIEELVNRLPSKSEEKEIQYKNVFGTNLAIKYKGKTRISELFCLGCGARWIKERPVTQALIEIICPNCGKGRLVIETGDEYTKVEE